MTGLIALSGIRHHDYTLAVATFGENLRRLREQARPKITQADLAKRLGHTSNSTISKLENSTTVPEPETIRQVAEAAGFSTSLLLENVVTEYDLLRAVGQTTTAEKGVQNRTAKLGVSHLEQGASGAGKEGTLHGSNRDHLPQPASSVEAEMRRLQEIEDQFDWAERLDEALERIKFVAHALRRPRIIAKARPKQPQKTGRPSPLRRREAGGGKKR